MSRKVFDTIVAGIEAALARAKAAGRLGKASPVKAPRRARRRPPDGYSRSEVTNLGASFPTRGRLCHQCGLRIPEFAELSKASQRRISALAAADRPMMAIQELRALTGCSLLWRSYGSSTRAVRGRSAPVHAARSAASSWRTRGCTAVPSAAATGKATPNGIRTVSTSP